MSSFYNSPRRRNIDTFQETLRAQTDRNKSRQSLLWCTINIALLAIVWYDLQFRCPRPTLTVLYAEYAIFALFLLNTIYHFICFTRKSQSVTSALNNLGEQPYKSILDTSIMSAYTPNSKSTISNVSFSTTPMNMTATSWRSNRSSFGEGRSLNSFNQTQDSPQFSIHRQHTNSHIGEEFINDENSLTEYLKQYKEFEKSTTATKLDKSNGATNSFWTHPSANSKSEELSQFFRRSQYQLSPMTPDLYRPTIPTIIPTGVQYHNNSIQHCRCCCCCCPNGSSSSSPGRKSNHVSPRSNSNMGTEMWRHFQVDSLTLTQWNANLRLWISQTIVERLVKEIEHVDECLQKQGISDVHIGQVGLERLKSTAQMAPVLQGIPTLWTLIPFLSLTSNQEYLIKRLKELAKGGCMSSFKWNGGSSYNGKEWNESLPTDSAIIMHLFATYLDTQLLPSPSHPDLKPFTGNHFIKYSDKLPICDSTTLAIYECNEKPPQYSVIVGEEIFNMVKGYNNLFHTILLFLYQVNKRQSGMLGRINLGKAGVNILWVIDS